MKNNKFKGKYKGGSRRLKGWDYSSTGLYFLTIVTQGRECNLGKIENAEIILSDFGKIVEKELNKSFEIRNELILHEYVIMPNHIHCIVEIDNNQIFNNNFINELLSIKRNIPPRKPKSISSFVAGFKSAVNSKIDDYIDEKQLDIPKYNKKNHFFQINFHDHVVRNRYEYVRIRKYIVNNPKNWNKDLLSKN